MRITRRGLSLGAAALAAAGAGALGYGRIFAKHYAPTPYDDLLHQIVDREPAALLGKAAAQIPGQDVATLAAKLRQPGFALKDRARNDAGAGRVMEAGGWVVPETVAFYSALAAQFS